MNALLSIKPKYVKNIIAGTKQFEFRKQPLSPSVKRVYIYCSAPEKKIIGYFELREVIQDTPKNLWHRFKNEAGISSGDFFQYYDGKEVGYAISISNLIVLKKPIDPYKRFENFTPPQSFLYLRKGTQKTLF